MYGKACIKIQDGFDFLTLQFLQVILKYAYLCHGWEMILKIQTVIKIIHFLTKKSSEFTTPNKLRWYLIEFCGKIYKKWIISFILSFKNYRLFSRNDVLTNANNYLSDFTTNSHS